MRPGLYEMHPPRLLGEMTALPLTIPKFLLLFCNFYVAFLKNMCYNPSQI